jgi:hypothetical protein
MTYKPALIKKRELIVFAMVMMGLVAIFYKPIFSYDVWVHLKMGEHIVQHDYQLPIEDPFSQSTENKPLIHHEWLSQIILYLIHHVFGFSGIRIIRVVLLLTALTFVFRAVLRLTDHFPFALLALLVTAYLFRTRSSIRPELFSLLFLTMFYTWFLLTRRKLGHIGYVLFLVFSVLWINLHPFMMFSGCIITILLAAKMVSRIRGIDRWFKTTKLPFNPYLLFLIFLVASLINPYGYEIYGYVFDATPFVKKYIQEWQPIFVSLQRTSLISITGGVLGFPLIMKSLVIGIIVLFLVVLSLSYLRKILWTVEDVIIGLLMSYMAMTSARFAWLLFVPVLYIVKYGRIHMKNGRLLERLKPVMVPLLWGGVTISCLYWLSEGYYKIPYNLKHEIQRDKYPDAPVKILKEANLAGRLYNPNAWGGYLMYHLYPDYKVFVDTRTYLHGEANVVTSMLIQYQYPGFEKLIDKGSFDILLFKKMFGDKRPFYSPEWTIIFENTNSALYLRHNNRNAMNLQKVIEYYKKNNVPFDPKKGFDLEILKKDKYLAELYRLS